MPKEQYRFKLGVQCPKNNGHKKRQREISPSISGNQATSLISVRGFPIAALTASHNWALLPMMCVACPKRRITRTGDPLTIPVTHRDSRDMMADTRALSAPMRMMALMFAIVADSSVVRWITRPPYNQYSVRSAVQRNHFFLYFFIFCDIS